MIIAKVWLIGRAYAAAIERRRDKGEFLGDAVYEESVAPKIREGHIDVWFKELAEHPEDDSAFALTIHKKLTDLLNTITGLQKRSFASKYLHFHFPTRFFIYDSRADKSVRQLNRATGRRRQLLPTHGDTDATYADFFERCKHLARHIRVLIGHDLNARELDKVLLEWNRRTLRLSGGDFP